MIRKFSTGACRNSPTPARSGWRSASAPFRASSATLSRSTSGRCRLRGLGPDRGALSPLSRAIEGAGRTRATTVRPSRCCSTAIPCPATPPTSAGWTSCSATATAPARRRASSRTSRRACARAGYRVRRNKPFAGGFITEHFGAPGEGAHAVQIEIARALYLNERRIVRTERWTALRDDLFAAAKALAGEFGGDLGQAVWRPNEIDRNEKDRRAAAAVRVWEERLRRARRGHCSAAQQSKFCDAQAKECARRPALRRQAVSTRQKRRPPCCHGGLKSREETPKEGICGRSCRTATISA